MIILLSLAVKIFFYHSQKLNIYFIRVKSQLHAAPSAVGFNVFLSWDDACQSSVQVHPLLLTASFPSLCTGV